MLVVFSIPISKNIHIYAYYCLSPHMLKCLKATPKQMDYIGV